jgi:hypothetical protein
LICVGGAFLFDFLCQKHFYTEGVSPPTSKKPSRFEIDTFSKLPGCWTIYMWL